MFTLNSVQCQGDPPEFVDPLHESSSAAYSPRVRRLDLSYQAPPNPYGFGGAYGENFLGDHYGETFRGYPQIHG
ncbi:hypothetical protein M8J75_006617 [Diaphorina citri]|nr:hypothetical protein M8J75_006617 [Diaphorina citri]